MAWMRAAPLWAALAAGGLALAVAVGVQHAGIVPCALCYLERWPYRVVIGLALIGLAWRAARPLLLWAVLAGLIAAAGLAALHVGVEARWWKSPLPECAAPVLNTASIKDLLASMPARPAKPCDSPTYLVPGLPLSMAAMNLGYALAAVAIVAILDRRRVRR